MDQKDFAALKEKVWAFMHEHIYPNERTFHEQCHAISHSSSNEWTHAPILVKLKQEAKRQGLWNMFLPVDSAQVAGSIGSTHVGMGLTNLQYGDICEILGTACPAEFAAQATNCTSPDTGNMEVLARFGNQEQKERWLAPLLEGKIRSAFAMTEPAVASSDATNISIRIDREGDEYVINGRKWWITGAGSLHCQIMILMGKTNPEAALHKQQSQILVPMATPGITLMRPMTVFGDDDAPKGHMEILFENVRVPVANVLLGEGRGFEISQARLGPGRIHHCMRAIGQAERALSLMCKRVQSRVAFRKPLAKMDTIMDLVAKCRAEITQARLLIQRAAHLMDTRGNKDAETRALLSLVKAHVPAMVQQVADRAIQAHGAAGLCSDFPLAMIFMGARMLRIADGPDEVHWRKAGQLELRMQKKSPLYDIPSYPKPTSIFRRTTDPISAAARSKL